MIERKRLEALARVKLMDTDPEPAFDRLTRLAAQLLDAPVSLFTLVDDHRQFFKSAHGLDLERVLPRLSALSHSYCQHVVSSGAPLIIPDASAHALVKDNPARLENGFVAYLGVPVRDRLGFVLGALSGIDYHARTWGGRDVDALLDLAEVAATEIQIRELGQSRTARLSDQAARTEASPDVICVMDAELRIVEVGARAENVWGYAPDELVGRKLVDVLAPDERERTAAQLRAITGGRSRGDFENRSLRKDGTLAPVYWSAIWSEDDGTYYAIARDRPEPRAPDIRPSSDASILVVDDYTEIGVLVRTALQFAGYLKVDVVNNPIRALDLASRKRYAMVIADLRMEPINGVDLLWQMRMLPGMADALVLIISAYSNRSVIDKMKKVGVDGFIAKPFRTADLLRHVKLAFEAKKSQLAVQ